MSLADMANRLDFTDRSSRVLFGDACAAAALTRSVSSAGLELVDTHVRGFSSQPGAAATGTYTLCSKPGSSMQNDAVLKTVDTVRILLKRNNLSADEVDAGRHPVTLQIVPTR